VSHCEVILKILEKTDAIACQKHGKSGVVKPDGKKYSKGTTASLLRPLEWTRFPWRQWRVICGGKDAGAFGAP